MKVPYYRQKKPYTCGPAALRMVLAAVKKRYSEDYLARLAGTSAQNGTSSIALRRTLRRIGVEHVVSYDCTYRRLRSLVADSAVIVDWMPQVVYPDHPEFQECKDYDPRKDSHCAVVTSVGDFFVTLQDPVLGRKVRLSRGKFIKAWRDPIYGSKRFALAV